MARTREGTDGTDIIGVADLKGHRVEYLSVPHQTLEGLFDRVTSLAGPQQQRDLQWLEQVHPGVRTVVGTLSHISLVLFDDLLDHGTDQWVVTGCCYPGRIRCSKLSKTESRSSVRSIVKVIKSSPGGRLIRPPELVPKAVRDAFADITVLAWPRVDFLLTWLLHDPESAILQ